MMQRNWTRGIVGAHLASLILGGGVGVLISVQVVIAWCLGLLVAVTATSLQGWVLKTWGEQGLWWSQGLKWLVWVTVGGQLAETLQGIALAKLCPGDGGQSSPLAGGGNASSGKAP